MTAGEPVICSGCGAQEPDQPLTWTVQTGRGQAGTDIELVCARCTREHVRSMEAQLDREHW